MLPEDRNAFLRFAQERDLVVLVARYSDSAELQPIADPDIGPDAFLCLWNREILPRLERRRIPKAGKYEVDTLNTPILEFDTSFTATWEGKPALGQGRLYGIFDPDLGKPPEFEKWYERLVRWIRAKYEKNPTDRGGYVGPAAYEFYKGGGYLLPNFLPPRTEVWLAEIGRQDASRRAGEAGRKSRAGRSFRRPSCKPR